MTYQKIFEEIKEELYKQKRQQSDIEQIEAAYNWAKKLHDGQFRISQEPYIIHPLEVAKILVDLKLDKNTIIAAFLHDVLEDTDTTAEEMKEKFGQDVVNLVQGVTKLSKYQFKSKEERQAENFRRMLIAMAQDIRVVVLKLTDRLHNMRTLAYMTTAKQKKIAQETMDIFAPLANRLGMGKIKADFNLCHPDVLVVSHASNVCGFISPIKQLCALSKEYDCTNIIDMCQSAGIVDVELASFDFTCRFIFGLFGNQYPMYILLCVDKAISILFIVFYPGSIGEALVIKLSSQYICFRERYACLLFLVYNPYYPVINHLVALLVASARVVYAAFHYPICVVNSKRACTIPSRYLISPFPVLSIILVVSRHIISTNDDVTSTICVSSMLYPFPILVFIISIGGFPVFVQAAVRLKRLPHARLYAHKHRQRC